MKELKFEDLSIKQKLGMLLTATYSSWHRSDELDEFIIKMIKEHSLGSIWIQAGLPNAEDLIKMVKDVADYPILIVTDAESGIGDYKVGKHNAIGCTGSEKHAYAFGKVVGATARKMGYNLVCDPVVDLSNDGNMRSMGCDEKQVALLAKAMVKGMHDSGVLSITKHYAGGNNVGDVDSHMAPTHSDNTKEELLNYYLYPYLELIKEDLLDGIMVGHKIYDKIDPKMPASLSKPMIDLIREQGFNGVAMTDALLMMSIRSKYDFDKSIPLSIMAGIDLSLPYNSSGVKTNYEALCNAYENGELSDDVIDAGVKRVLEAQHKAFELEKQAKELTDEDIEIFNNINKDGIYAKTDDGISIPISKDGKHFFVVLAKIDAYYAEGKVEVDTFSGGWHNPEAIKTKIKELFPHSDFYIVGEWPAAWQNSEILSKSVEYDDVIFVTFTERLAYAGPECLTSRIIALYDSLNRMNKLSTVVHFGNPFVLESLGHVSRYIIGGHSSDSINAALEVLSGDYPANGKPTYNAKLN